MNMNNNLLNVFKKGVKTTYDLGRNGASNLVKYIVSNPKKSAFIGIEMASTLAFGVDYVQNYKDLIKDQNLINNAGNKICIDINNNLPKIGKKGNFFTLIDNDVVSIDGYDLNGDDAINYKTDKVNYQKSITDSSGSNLDINLSIYKGHVSGYKCSVNKFEGSKNDKIVELNNGMNVLNSDGKYILPLEISQLVDYVGDFYKTVAANTVDVIDVNLENEIRLILYDVNRDGLIDGSSLEVSNANGVMEYTNFIIGQYGEGCVSLMPTGIANALIYDGDKFNFESVNGIDNCQGELVKREDIPSEVYKMFFIPEGSINK